MSDNVSLARQFAGAALWVLGTMSLALSVGYLATGRTLSPIPAQRPLIGLILGMVVALLGYRTSTGAWTGAALVPYYGVVLGGFYFLATVIWALAHRLPIQVTSELVAYVIISVGLIASWFWHTRRIRRRKRLAA